MLHHLPLPLSSHLSLPPSLHPPSPPLSLPPSLLPFPSLPPSLPPTHISVLHPDGHHRGQYVQGLPHDGPGLQGVGLQQTVEHLQDNALVDGELHDDVGQQEMAVVLGGWVLEGGGGEPWAQFIVCHCLPSFTQYLRLADNWEGREPVSQTDRDRQADRQAETDRQTNRQAGSPHTAWAAGRARRRS